MFYFYSSGNRKPRASAIYTRGNSSRRERISLLTWANTSNFQFDTQVILIVELSLAFSPTREIYRFNARSLFTRVCRGKLVSTPFLLWKLLLSLALLKNSPNYLASYIKHCRNFGQHEDCLINPLYASLLVLKAARIISYSTKRGFYSKGIPFSVKRDWRKSWKLASEKFHRLIKPWKARRQSKRKRLDCYTLGFVGGSSKSKSLSPRELKMMHTRHGWLSQSSWFSS